MRSVAVCFAAIHLLQAIKEIIVIALK